MEDNSQVIAAMIIGGFFYFIPALVAWYRSHHNTAAITALNFFLGWTIIGWVGSLIWALTKVERSS